MRKLTVFLVVLMALFLISCQSKEQLFSIEFELNGAEIELDDFENIKSGSEITLPSLTREHYTFLGWYTLIQGEKVYVENAIIVSDNMKLYADWKPNVYIVTFYHDLKIINRQNVDYLDDAYSPIPPFKEGYHFVGWDKAFTNITGNLDVYAQFAINVYTVRFFDKDNLLLKEESIEHLKSSTPPEIPTYDGYVFTGWSTSFTQITKNTDIYATYALGQYLVEFKNEAGETISIQTPYHGDDLVEPTPPVKVGYTFVGWSSSLENVQQSMVITPQYIRNSYTVTFYNDDNEVIHTTLVEYGDDVVNIPDMPSKEGYHSVGWNHSLTNIRENTSVHPVYYIKSFYVNFRSHLGLAFDIQLIEYGKAANVPSFIPTPVGYHFTGWSRTFDIITENIDVFAQYEINTYTVIFKDLDENILLETTIQHGETAFAPVPPTIEGKNHVGWTSDITAITSDLTIYPVYEWKTYQVTFRQDNEVIIEVVTVQHGGQAIAPANPSKEGHLFVGWNTSFSHVTSSFDVYPIYSKMEYTVTFYDGVGQILEQVIVLYMDQAIPTIIPTKEGHHFVGWQQDISQITSHLDVYPLFEPKVYLANFYDDSRYIIISQQVPYGTSPEIPVTPTHSTLYFEGWYIDLALTIPYTFGPMPAYSISIYSKWIEYSLISPIITGFSQSVTLEYGEAFDPLSGVTASDIPDGDLTDFIIVSGWDDAYVYLPGEYEVTLSVEDSHGNAASVSFWVTVNESLLPLSLSTQPVTITLWHAMGEANRALMQKYADSFRAHYLALGHDLTVNIPAGFGNYDTLKSNTIMSITTGDIPNLVQGYPDHVSEYLNGNGVLSLNPYIYSNLWGLNGDDALDDIIQSYREENSQYDTARTFYSLPFNKSTEVMIYNKTAYDALGLTYPQTWQDVIAHAPLLKAYGDAIAEAKVRAANPSFTEGQLAPLIAAAKMLVVPVTYESQNMFITFANQFGGAYTSTDFSSNIGQLLWVNNTNTFAAMTFLNTNKSIITIPEYWGQNYASVPFVNQQTFVTIGSSAGVRYNIPATDPTTQQPVFEIGIGPVPYNANMPENKAVIQQGTNVSVMKTGTAQQQLVSWLFLKWLIKTENTVDWAINTGYLPVRTSGLLNPTYQEFLNNPTEDQLIFSMAANAAHLQSGYMFYDPAFIGSSIARQEVRNAIIRIMTGDGNITQSLIDAYENTVPFLQSYTIYPPTNDPLENARNQLILSNVSSGVLTDIALPTTIGAEGVTVTWSSSNPDVITDLGVVTRQPENIVVVLTATLHLNGQQLTKEFEVIVLGFAEFHEVANLQEAIEWFQTGVSPDPEVPINYYVKIPGVTIFGRTTEGFMFGDSTGMSFAYTQSEPNVNWIVGNVYDFYGLADFFNGNIQFNGVKSVSQPIQMLPSTADVTVLTPTVVTDIEAFIASLPTFYADKSSPLTHQYIQLTAKVRYQSSDNYHTMFVNPSYDGPDINTAAQSPFTTNALIVYYKSNKADLVPFNGITVTVNVFLFSLRNDRTYTQLYSQELLKMYIIS